MVLTLICPKCGIEKKIDNFKGKVCSKCYMKDSNIIDLKSKDITLCRSCARIRTKSLWQAFFEDELKNVVTDNIKTELDDYKINDVKTEFVKDKIKIIINVSGLLLGKKYDTMAEFVIKPNYTMCEDCYKNMSDYFQTIIQVRFEKQTLEKEEYKKVLQNKSLEQFSTDLMQKIIKNSRKDGDYTANLQKTEQTKNGFDMYVGSKNQAIKFIVNLKQFFKLERKESSKLMGYEHSIGRDKLRHTLLVKIV